MSSKFIKNEYEGITFDDVLIRPKFSRVSSRKLVDISSNELSNLRLRLPIISANMDTVTNSTMAKAMAEFGAIGCLHRFMTIEENVNEFKNSIVNGKKPIVSVGISWEELERASALLDAGAETICIDVAHGAQLQTTHQYKRLVEIARDRADFIVGNFATKDSIESFNYFSDCPPPVFKIGIGPGSACTTRVKTGVGVPQLAAVLECSDNGKNRIIADGGCKTAGDVVKAFAAGAGYVMLGGMLAGTDETPGEVKDGVKLYRGSASKDSYDVQNKNSSWRTAEGESFSVPYKGSVNSILSDIEGGLRSALSYTNCETLQEFRETAQFMKVSTSTIAENRAHGKK